MMKLNLKKGFTLIELLVVIAIIGILSGIVLSSLNSARNKGADAAIKGNLGGARAQAELFYASNSNSYSGVCAAASLADGTKSINAQVDAARVAGGFGQALNITAGTAGAWNTATCHDAAGGWAAEAPLKASVSGTPSMFCVDSTGAAKTNAAALAANITVC